MMRPGFPRVDPRAARRSLAILAALGVALLGIHAQSAQGADEARVRLTEVCSFDLPPGNGVVLKTKVKLRSIGSVPAVVNLLVGWTVERLYPKAKTARTLRLDVGQVTQFSITRTIPNAPVLRAALTSSARLHCASVFTVRPAKA